jgi:iron complex outermembrane receptor protein
VDDPNFQGNAVGGISGGVGNNVQINSEGFPRNTFFLYEQVYDENGMPLEDVYVDQNGDGAINNEDLVRSKASDPDVFMGFNTYIQYKRFSLNANARMQIGNYVYNNIESRYAFVNGAFENNTLRNRLRSIYRSGFVEPQYLSDFYLEDASFFRLDNITFAYQINRFFNDRINGSASFTIQNALVITDYRGLDPEISNGIDNNLYPRPRVFTLGLTLNFK